MEREITARMTACPARHAASVVEKKKKRKEKKEKRKKRKKKVEEECCNEVEGSHPTAFTVNYGCTKQA